MRDDLLQIRCFGVSFYALRDHDGLHLIDSGFIGGVKRLQQALKKKGWDHLPVKGIIVTHGHLDHILNVSRIAVEHGAWIAAPRLDAAHYRGTPAYKGATLATGMAEALGRRFLNYAPFTPTRFLDDGDTFDVWHGLTTVHLPGHTPGHSGYYCSTLKLLFCGDLFASFGAFSHLPPQFLNTENSEIIHSAEKAFKLDLQGLLPNHGDDASPEIHLQRLKSLTGKE